MRDNYLTPEAFWCDMELLRIIAESNDMIDPGVDNPWGNF